MTDSRERKPIKSAERAADESAALLDLGLPVLFGVAVLGAIIVTYLVFRIGIHENVWDQKGPIGDFFGGILNPILTFLTFLGVLITIKLQVNEMRLSREELELTRRELKGSRLEAEKSAIALAKQVDAIDKQNFESTFFQMMGLLAQIVRDMAIKDGHRIAQGRAAFGVAVDNLGFISARYAAGQTGAARFAALKRSYEEIFGENRQHLGQYFRYLHTFLVFIDDAKDIDRQKYIDLLTGHLSDAEMIMLFYNALSHEPKKYVYFFAKYGLIRSAPIKMLYSEEDMREMERRISETLT